MTESKPYYRTRLRDKGQLTLPSEVRQVLGVGEGDDLAFYLNDQGQIVLERLQVIPPEQAWFWSRRWQQMERAVDAEIAAGQMHIFDDIEALIGHLDAEHPEAETGGATDAED
jgi:AbrB family looped-hinge helix DNA binding protein